MSTARLTRVQAAGRLGVSLQTLDRMIARGEVNIERESWGQRHRVWVLEEGLEGIKPFARDGGEAAFLIQDNERLEQVLERQGERIAELEALLAEQRQRTADADQRYFELMAQFRETQERLKEAQAISSALTRALPEPSQQRWKAWWPFRR